MKQFIFSVFLLLFITPAFAQADTSKFECFIPSYTFPSFPGGDSAFQKFLLKNIHYPDSASQNGIGGVVWVSFKIDSSGVLYDFKRQKSIAGHPEFCDEVIRVLKLSPKWVVTENDKKFCPFSFTKPFRFTANANQQVDLSEPMQKKQVIWGGPQLSEDSLGTVVSFAEVMPEFPGGYDAYLVKHIQILDQNAICASTSVYVSFIVTTEGKVVNAQIVKGLENCPETQKSVLKTISGMPAWSPGSLNNHPVNTSMTIKLTLN